MRWPSSRERTRAGDDCAAGSDCGLVTGRCVLNAWCRAMRSRATARMLAYIGVTERCYHHGRVSRG